MPEALPKAFLRWAGSKRKLLPKLLPYWHSSQNQRYVEPFMGSAALFFCLKPKAALLSDINSELVDTFLAVRDHSRAVYNRCIKLPTGRESYYKIRAQNASRLTDLDRAARFIYLNRYCFNGIYRTNLKGHFNVPFAASKTGSLPDWDSFSLAANALRNAEIISSDFECVIDTKIRQGDFVYLDPPYAVANRRIFRQYGPQTFGLDDIARLREILRVIDKRGAKFLVSYALCAEAITNFSEWDIKRTITQRNVAGFARHRRKAAEMLITNIADGI